MTISGVVLMTYGAPRDRSDLPAYLARVRGGKEPSEELVAEMARRYELIGGSPLVAITTAQATALERYLGRGYLASAGMRFSEPSIAVAVEALVAAGAERIVGIVMSPQWSPGLMGGYARSLEDAVRGRVPSSVAGAWHREPAFVEAIAGSLRRSLQSIAGAAPLPPPPAVMVVLTAHSLPKRVFDAEPEYLEQLRETADLVAARAALRPDRWRWAYQSAGHTAEEWLRPDLKELFPELAASGESDVLVAPVQFLADHLEVLYDLDVAAADEAKAAGLRYHRVAMPNTDPAFIAALARIVHREEAAVGA